MTDTNNILDVVSKVINESDPIDEEPIHEDKITYFLTIPNPTDDPVIQSLSNHLVQAGREIEHLDGDEEAKKQALYSLKTAAMWADSAVRQRLYHAE